MIDLYDVLGRAIDAAPDLPTARATIDAYRANGYTLYLQDERPAPTPAPVVYLSRADVPDLADRLAETK